MKDFMLMNTMNTLIAYERAISEPIKSWQQFQSFHSSLETNWRTSDNFYLDYKIRQDMANPAQINIKFSYEKVFHTVYQKKSLA